MTNKKQHIAKETVKIHFSPWHNLGKVLLVGEGNLSFARSLLQMPNAEITNMTATIFEDKDEISQETFDNTNALNKLGAHVLFRVDATKLEKSIAACKYDTIIFQFPNVGSREAKYNRNPNHIMIRKFLKSANNYLNPTGKVMITVVENSHYYGAFDFQDAAAFAGYEILISCAFDPAMFSDYSHQNTKDEDSALEQHKRFATWIFKLKK